MTGRPRSWTDGDLIRAVEESTTISDVLRRLGLAVGGGSLIAVRRRILELGLDNPVLLGDVRSDAWAADPDDDLAQITVRGRWTDDDLRWAVTTATSMTEVMHRLGYPSSGSLWTVAKAQILALGLDTSHFGSAARRRTARPPRSPERRRSWSDEDLRTAVRASQSVAGVIRALGLKVGGSVYVAIKERIAELGLDTSHFTGQGWSKGRSVTTWKGRPLEEILVKDSDYRSTASLRRRLIKEGLKEERCEGCGGTEWRGLPIPLQLDHINGDRTDNRLENLRILCPNCHSQTDTWCGKNIGKVRTMSASASVAKLAYARASRSRVERHEGSSPSRGTRPTIQLSFGDLDDLD
jgi:5-methylcytosine-specific restriction endonuclease McrA